MRVRQRAGTRAHLEDDELVWAHPWGALRVRRPPRPLRTATGLITRAGAAGLEHARLAGEIGEPAAAAVLRALACCLTVSLCDAEGRPVIDAEPLHPGARWAEPVRADRTARWSRYASVRAEGGEVVAESPLGGHRITVHDGRLLAALPAAAAAGPVSALSWPPAVTAWLAASGLLAVADDDGSFPEDARETAAWSPQDLASWWRSRPGLHDRPVGATPASAAADAEGGPTPVESGSVGVLPLPRADITRLRDEDRTLTAVLEDRRSVREHGGEPLTAAAVGEFLDRCFGLRQAPDRAGRRAFPSAGAIEDLTVYLVVGRCTGVPPGVHRYDPGRHALVAVPPGPPGRDGGALLRGAARTAGVAAAPDLLVVLTSRVSRLAAKYAGLAYSLTLRNAGVLYQSMYLVGASMGLATCALGFTDSRLTAGALGLELPGEVPVGEFMIGSPGTGGAPAR